MQNREEPRLDEISNFLLTSTSAGTKCDKQRYTYVLENVKVSPNQLRRYKAFIKNKLEYKLNKSKCNFVKVSKFI